METNIYLVIAALCGLWVVSLVSGPTVVMILGLILHMGYILNLVPITKKGTKEYKRGQNHTVAEYYNEAAQCSVDEICAS